MVLVSVKRSTPSIENSARTQPTSSMQSPKNSFIGPATISLGCGRVSTQVGAASADTTTVKLCVASGRTPLAARTVTGKLPIAAGVHEITPLAPSMVIPDTVVSRENVGAGVP